jgi:hypothetical protein
MRIVISAEGDGRERDLATLQKWLLNDSELSRSPATVEVGSPRQSSGQMGLGPDEIQILLGAATLALEVGNSLRSWLKSRQGTSRLVIHVDAPELAALLAERLGAAADVRAEAEDPENDPARPQAS